MGHCSVMGGGRDCYVMGGTPSCNGLHFFFRQSPSGWDTVLQWVEHWLAMGWIIGVPSMGHCLVMGWVSCVRQSSLWVWHCSVVGGTLACNGLEHWFTMYLGQGLVMGWISF